MMNSVTEDIFDWLREYFPNKMKDNLYDIDEVEDLYLKGKESQVGKFKENDILSYDYLDRGDMKTAVVIFKSHSRLENGDSKITVEGYFCYKTYVGCTDIYSDDKIVLELACTSPETNFVYFSDIRHATEKEKSRFFEIIGKMLPTNVKYAKF